MKTLVVIVLIFAVASLNFLRRCGPNCSCSSVNSGENVITVNRSGLFDNVMEYSLPYTPSWDPDGKIEIEYSDPTVAEVAYRCNESPITPDLIIAPKRAGTTEVSFTNSLDGQGFKVMVTIV